MKVLGLDLSLTATGWVVIDEAAIDTLTNGVIAHGSQSFPQLREIPRLQAFDVWIGKLLEEHAPELVGIEGYSYGTRSGATHAFAIGELGGLIKTAIAYERIPITIVPPSTWKKELAGKGTLAKDEVRLELFKRYGIEFKSQDTLDAWAVGMCALRQLRGVTSPAPRAAARSRRPSLHEQPELEVLSS